MSSERRSFAELNVAVFMLGLVPLFAKWLELSPAAIIFYRCSLGAVALAVIFRLRGLPLALPDRATYGRMLLAGVLLAGHFVTYFEAIQVSTVAVAMAATFTFPVMTVLLEPAIMGGRPHWVDLVLAVVAFSGVALVVGAGTDAGAVMTGAAWGLCSAALFAVRNVLSRKWFQDYPGTQTMFYQMVGAAVCLIPFTASPLAVDAPSWGLLVLLGFVFTAGAHSMFVGSMRALSAKTVGLVASLQPVYGITAAALLLAEIPSLRTAIGAAMVIGVAVVEGMRVPVQRRDQTPADEA